jgi:uncharacterized protein
VQRSGSDNVIIIYVDVDACPVKEQVYKVAARHGIKVPIIANSFIQIPRHPMFERIVVGALPDAVDDWIVAGVAPGAIVITADVPLATATIKSPSAKSRLWRRLYCCQWLFQLRLEFGKILNVRLRSQERT